MRRYVFLDRLYVGMAIGVQVYGRDAEVLNEPITDWPEKPGGLFRTEPIPRLSSPDEVAEHALGYVMHVL